MAFPNYEDPNWRKDEPTYTRGQSDQLMPNTGGPVNAGVPPISGRYDDSYGQLLDALKGGKTGNELLQNVLGNFRGHIGDLKSFMESPAWRTALAYSMKGSSEYQQLQGLQDPTKQALSVGLGQISQGGARGVQDSLLALNQMGLGRSAGAVAGVRQQGQLETAGKSAQFGLGANQQMYQNERARLGSLLEMEQAMQQLALGFSPQARQPDNGTGTGDWIKLALQGAATVAAFV